MPTAIAEHVVERPNLEDRVHVVISAAPSTGIRQRSGWASCAPGSSNSLLRRKSDLHMSCRDLAGRACLPGRRRHPATLRWCDCHQ